eukprot:TRINITY_DN75495_c0_g1_i1.p1 TRINITY_DN75495_c0_g1~~TRINITY_DN75495_c0_g1_i1.p1  ORF type:complete len:168 (-),score=35.32 TRINITY_DN75495_c0_g1_i1:88-591(-)
MSVLPPIIAAVGGGVPKLLWEYLPEVAPGKAMLASVFLFNMPHMVKMYVTAKATGDAAKIKNENPRAQFDELKFDKTYGDLLQRVQAAHQNGLESFPPFAAGLLAATVAGVDKTTIGKLAAFHLLARTAFNVFYIGFSTPGPAAVRSVMWMLSLLSSCQLLALSASK